jgi:Protein of unknown function DUF262
MSENTVSVDDHDESVDVLDESVADDEGLVDTEESSLNYFGADFDVSGLVRRLNDGDIVIPRFEPDEATGLSVEGFQRQRVWSAARMEQLVESLLLGWPIPSIFLVLEPDQRYLVLDGQQRLITLQAFYSGFFPNGRVFKLKDVAEHLQDATYSTLNQGSRRRLNNTFIQAIVIEPQGDDGRDSVYRLFGRLNSGGVILTAQEIRVALYRGPLINWIRDLNHDAAWRSLFGAVHKQLKDHELILRVLAMRQVVTRVDGNWDDAAKLRTVYRPPMSQFLNNFLQEHRDMEGIDASELQVAFSESCGIILRALGPDGLKFLGRLNAAHVDALLSVLIYLVERTMTPSDTKLQAAVQELRTDDEYIEYVSRSTSHRDSVLGRLRHVYTALTSQQ